MTTIRSNQTAVMFNNFGSSEGCGYEKGTSIDEIINESREKVERSKKNSWDKFNRDVLKPYIILYSDQTGKQLRRIDL